MTRTGGGDRVFFVTVALIFLSSVAATTYMCRSMAGGMPMPGGWIMSTPWMKMPGQTWPGAAASFECSWLLMMTAMMLPSLVPTLLAYRRAVRRLSGNSWLLTILVSAGYFFAWAGGGVVVYTLGVSVAMTTMQLPSAARLVPFSIGVLVLLAGFLQLTPWKARELACCRNPPLPVSLPVGHRSAWQHGVKLGAHCTLCCASLMGILLALGIMDLGAMTLVGAAIALERVTPWPVSAARVVGLGALAIGMTIIARAPPPWHLIT